MNWTSFALGIGAVLALQAVGFAAISLVRGNVREAAGWWYALHGWPVWVWLAPILARRYMRRYQPRRRLNAPPTPRERA